MSTTPPEAPRSRVIASVVAVVLMVGALVALGIGLNRVAGSNTAAGVATPAASPTPTTPPTPTPTPVPTPTPAVIAYADCSKATFGPVLQPLDPPSDVHTYKATPPMTIDTSKLYELSITTAKGTMVACLQPSLAPTTVNVVVTLARNHFYDGLKFHRVVPGFVVQGGDPKGDGTGGPGFSFNDEPVLNSYEDGSLAMANSGPNTNGSQFFICLPPVPGGQGSCSTLPHQYNLFGKLQSGLDVAAKIAQGDVMQTVTVREQQ